MKVVVVLDGADPTGLLLAAAAARIGHDTSVVDLRRSAFELRTGPGAGVRLHGAPLLVDAVVNRTLVNGLGLASAAALRRQAGSTWYELHSAAREEQGMLLAVFDWFAHEGVRVINPPRAAELESMRNVVIERLARRGVGVDARATPDASYLVAGGRIVLQPGQERPAASLLMSCALLAEIAGFDLGTVSFESSCGEPKVVGWASQPDLTHLDVATADAIAQSMVLELLGTSGGAAVSPTRPFVPDMVDRLGGN